MPSITTDQRPSRVASVERFFEAIQAGDYAALEGLLSANAVTRWPQSSEQVTGAMACIRIYESYPGGPPDYRVVRVLGEGDVWIAELIADYGTERWFVVSICEFEGARIARMTDYFGTALRAPEWRQDLVDPVA